MIIQTTGSCWDTLVIGVEMIGEGVRTIEGFPEKLASELKHCVIAHHGELEYGSPKKPALAEAVLALCRCDRCEIADIDGDL